MDKKQHWEQVYQTKAPDDVSWFQNQPTVSLQLIEATGVSKDNGIIDVGGGSSVLVDFLLNAGFVCPAVLEISAAALAYSKVRLGKRAADVEWYEADVTEFNPPRRFHVWHDRAVFHFLTDAKDRRKYVQSLMRALVPEGHVIIAAFALDGPTQCSGLNVARYDASSLCTELGREFQLVGQVDETHTTPWNTQQHFSYFSFMLNAFIRP
jgi:SAM-dependent methyltransferase